MGTERWRRGGIAAALAVCAAAASYAGDKPLPTLIPEQRRITFRPPEALPKYRLPDVPRPSTVARKTVDAEPLYLGLDEAIRQTLANADVIRVLAGVTAVASGQTIYDPAITNSTIDQQAGRFDPAVNFDSVWTQTENPLTGFDPLIPGGSRISSLQTRGANFNGNLSKQNALGGVASLGGTTTPQRFAPGVFPLNPQNPASLEVAYSQPLLQGAGLAANLTPILVSRVNTERSYYQLKDTVQEQVRGVIEGYWALVFARVDVWVREQQVEQTQEALRVADGRFKADLADIAEITQARTSLANFRASLIGAQASVLQREAALRNLMGLPPSDGRQLVPVTPPRGDRYDAEWESLCDLAAGTRPDLVDLQLTLQADEQLLAQARNTALPRADAQMLYRWKGLSGTQPNGERATAALGRFDDWTMGVNFSMPLGLRQARASQRQQELIVMRDRANLRQGVHNAVHQLATSVRALDQSYEQYLAFGEARRAARLNLERQIGLYRTGRAIYLNVLQAIVDWGATISAEANSLTQYNTQLANLERQTGTILETHGVYFFEEQFASTGPLGRLFPDVCYPQDLRPDYGAQRYPVSEKPSDESFDLERPGRQVFESPLPDLPYRDILPPRRQGPPLPDSPLPLLPRLPSTPDDAPPSESPPESVLNPSAKPELILPARFDAPRRRLIPQFSQ